MGLGKTGVVALSWSVEATQPANDDFENAQNLTGASGVIEGNTKGATRQPGEPEHLFPGTSSVCTSGSRLRQAVSRSNPKEPI